MSKRLASSPAPLCISVPMAVHSPLMLLAFAWGCGLWCGWVFPDGLMFLSGSISAVLCVLVLLRCRFPMYKAACIFLSALLAGVFAMRCAIPHWYGGKDPWAGKQPMVQGRVAELVWPDSPYVVLDQVLVYDASGVPTPIEGRLRLWITKVEDTGLQKGAVVMAPMELSMLEGASYPNSPNRQVMNLYRSIRMDASTGWTDAVATVPAPMLSWVERLRYTIAANLKHDFSQDGQALLRALLLGDSGSMQDNQHSLYARLGISHLLAVSGLHVDILLALGAVLPRLLERLFPKRYKACWLDTQLPGILLLGFFLLLTGWKASVGRAVIMYAMQCLSCFSKRGYNRSQGWAMAFLVLTAVSPLDLLSPGFQFSMAASGTLLWMKDSRASLRPWGRWTAPFVNTGWVVGGTWPWMLYYYGSLSFTAFAANMAVIPLVEVILLLGILYAWGIVLLPLLSRFMQPLLALLLRFYGDVLSFLDQFVSVMRCHLHVGWAAALAVVLTLLLSKCVVKMPRRYRIVVLACVLVLTVTAVAGGGWQRELQRGDMLCLGSGNRACVILREDTGWSLAGDEPQDTAVQLLQTLGKWHTLVYIGDHPETLRLWLDGEVRPQQVVVSWRLASLYGDDLASISRMYAVPILGMEEGKTVSLGEYSIEFVSFSAPSRGSLQHDALQIAVKGAVWLYLDPLQLTGEEAFWANVHGVIASRWSAQRKERAERTPAAVWVMSDGRYTDEALGNGLMYNMNRMGAVVLRPQRDATGIKGLGGKEPEWIARNVCSK